MSGLGLLLLFLLFLLPITIGMGNYMAQVFEGQRTFLYPVLHPLEKWTLRLGGWRKDMSATWQNYCKDLLWFNLMGGLLAFFIGIIPSHTNNDLMI